VEIEWILDEDLWKTLYNKTSTFINPWMIKLEQTSCTLCMNKFHLTLDKFQPLIKMDGWPKNKNKNHFTCKKFNIYQKWDLKRAWHLCLQGSKGLLKLKS
jgi:hypothetical protein